MDISLPLPPAYMCTIIFPAILAQIPSAIVKVKFSYPLSSLRFNSFASLALTSHSLSFIHSFTLPLSLIIKVSHETSLLSHSLTISQSLPVTHCQGDASSTVFTLLPSPSLPLSLSYSQLIHVTWSTPPSIHLAWFGSWPFLSSLLVMNLSQVIQSSYLIYLYSSVIHLLLAFILTHFVILLPSFLSPFLCHYTHLLPVFLIVWPSVNSLLILPFFLFSLQFFHF